MYWMAALVPEQGEGVPRRVQQVENLLELFWFDAQDVQIPPGESVTITNQVFAGAKEYNVVRAYQEAGHSAL